jgi:hypothetical protein
MHNQEVPLKTLDSSTITISDINAGTFVCTSITEQCDITYVITENITLTNS